MGPCDWDQESYCINRCGNPATHTNIIGVLDENFLTELICCACALFGES